jgi:DNA-binding response OmpR family regulator
MASLGLSGRKFVVIEDDEEVLKLVAAFLTEAGGEVVSTMLPQRGVELIRAARPDLVVCDVVMPGFDGYAVLTALQSDPATAHYPLVFLSGQRDFGERVRAFRAGAVDYLTKPFTRETLVRRLERVLEALARRASTQGPGAPGLAPPPPAAAGAPPLEEAAPPSPGPPPPTPAAAPALAPAPADARRDPGALPRTDARVPTFDALPEVLRDVLIVDDNPAFRRFLRGVLEGQGFVVHEAADGDEGLTLALDRRPWLILTDVKMPVMDGFEFCRRVRSHSLIHKTPLLFLSGWDEYEQRYQGLELGADDFLSKDTSVRELLIRIQLLTKRYDSLAGRGLEASMEGEIGVIGAPALLQVCHLSRLTGVLHARDGSLAAEVRFREGEVVGADCEGLLDTTAIFALLAWGRGRFRFEPRDPGDGSPLGRSFNQLVLEGCRQLDERNRGRSEGAGEAKEG